MEDTPPEDQEICRSWDFAPREQSQGPRECKIPPDANLEVRLEAASLTFFFPERECIGNYPSNSRGVLTVHKFNTLPLYKKKNVKYMKVSYCFYLRE